MSESLFLVGRKRVLAKDAKAIKAIAKRHEASFIHEKMPDGFRYWFTCEDLGIAYTRAVRSAILKDLEAEGLVLP